jgi:hypothetical protein
MLSLWFTCCQVQRLDPVAILREVQTVSQPLLSAHQSRGDAQPKKVLQFAERTFDCRDGACCTVGGVPTWDAMPAVLKCATLALLQPLCDSDAFAGDLAAAHSKLLQALVEEPPSFVVSSATGMLLRVRHARDKAALPV